MHHVMNIQGVPIVQPEDLFKTVFLFAGRFHVPGLHHRILVEMLSMLAADTAEKTGYLAEVVVWPVAAYDERDICISIEHRKQLVARAFADIPHVMFRWDDLENGGYGYTPTVDQYDRLANVPDQELRGLLRHRLTVPSLLRQVFIVAGADNVARETVLSWEQGDWLFDEAPWIIFTRPGHVLTDAPPHRTVIEVDLPMCATDIIAKIERGEEWESLVANRRVADYIKQHGLYGYGGAPVTAAW